METSLLPSSLDDEAAVNKKRSTALEMVLSREAMKQAVTENLEAYHHRQATSTQEARRKTRVLRVGDVVLVFRETGSRLKDK